MADMGSITGAGEGAARIGRVAGDTGSTSARQAGDEIRRGRESDSVDLSEAARAASRLPEARSAEQAERIAAIRSQIEAGTYETPDKLDAAIDRLIADVQG